jgi:pyruvate/2-oxoglutarate dehydrogenase complex dihydrolipoamide dehydrogenase (E3) component
MADEHYDAIVIGTSQGGRFLPIELARAGHKVALRRAPPTRRRLRQHGVHPDQDDGCQRALAYQARRGAEYGVRIGPVSVDLAAVRERNGPWSPARDRTTRAAWRRTGST